MRNYAYVAGAALAVILSASAHAGSWWLGGMANDGAAEDPVGTWRLDLADGSAVCALRLFDGQRADASTDCPAGLSHVSGWHLESRTARLVDADGGVLARLQVRDGGDWTGRNATGAPFLMSRE